MSRLGVCGKDETTAALRDVLTHLAKGIGMYAHRAGRLGKRDCEADVFVIEALFSTVTNVDFDPERLEEMIRRAVEVRTEVKAMYEAACAEADCQPEVLDGPAARQLETDSDALVFQGQELAILN